MEKVKNIWFSNERIFVEATDGLVFSQPMMFFSRLSKASDAQRQEWTQSPFGLHWNKIEEDISFESFTWADNDPKSLYHLQT
jgi:hypothetical protein